MRTRRVLTWIGLAVGAFVLAKWWNQTSFEPQIAGDETPLLDWLRHSSRIPVVILLVALVISWWRPLIGAIAFLGYFVMPAVVVGIQNFPFVLAGLIDLIFVAEQGLVGALLLAAWLAGRDRSPVRRLPADSRP